jgi:hypothetical protein
MKMGLAVRDFAVCMWNAGKKEERLCMLCSMRMLVFINVLEQIYFQ